MTVERVKLAKVVDVKGGKRLPAGATFSSEPTAHPYIRGQDIRGGRIRAGEQLYITEVVFERIRRYTVKEGDVCVTIVGNIGDVGVTPPGLDGANLTENAVKLIPTTSKLDSRFLAYALLSPEAQQQMKLSAAGAAQPKLGIYKVNDIEIPLPAVDSQRRIAAILSAYDDLIDNNTRRIAILEEMARRIYEEWFVRFRFPGHEGLRMVGSELGLVPEGWQCGAFTDIADVLSGGTPKKAQPEFWGGTIPFFTPTDAPKTAYVLDTEAHITDSGLERCASQLYPKDTVFITARGTVGKLALAAADMAMNQSCYALRSRCGYGQVFLYLATQGVVRELKAKSHGAVFDTIIMDTFRLMRIVKAPVELAKRLESLVRPLFALSMTLCRKNANLRVTRDLLLPKLISGERSVENIEIAREAP